MADESLSQYALKLISAEALALERRAAELRRQADAREIDTFDALMNKAEGIFEAARGVRSVEALLQAKLAARTTGEEPEEEAARTIREHLREAGAVRVWLGTMDSTVEDLRDATVSGGGYLMDQAAIRVGNDLIDPADGGRWLTIRAVSKTPAELERLEFEHLLGTDDDEPEPAAAPVQEADRG